MSSRVATADQIITALEALNQSDVDFVLSVVDARFPRGNRSSNSGGRGGRGGGRGGRGGRGGLKQAPATVAIPNPIAQNGYGRGGGLGPAQSAGPVAVPLSAADAVLVQEDHLSMVLLELQPIILHLPEVKRDPAADKPSMTRKSVQQRLNKKRSELQKALGNFMESSVDNYWCFESLNGIQKFRLAATDANATVDVRLRTNPLPAAFSELIAPMRAMCAEREQNGEVSTFGFLTNDDRRFTPPMEDGQDDAN